MERKSDQELRDELEPLWRCFSDPEVVRLKAVHDVLPRLDDEHANYVTATLEQAAESLPLIAKAIKTSPNAGAHTYLGSHERDNETLIETLCQVDETGMELMMPTGAVLGRAFVQAKINFLKALQHVCTESGEVASDIAMTIGDLVGDAVFSKLAEELFSAAISNPTNPPDLKKAAARKLIHMWNNRLKLPISEFPSVLLSAWRARRKVRAIFGTLIGVTEVVSLITAECEPRFVSYFARDHATEDEQQAFQEFLFGLAYEELNQLRDYMKENNLSVVTPDDVGRVVRSGVKPAFFGYPTPDQMYASFCRRRTRAEYRLVTGSRGPRKTAEGYIMEAILREDIDERGAETGSVPAESSDR